MTQRPHPEQAKQKLEIGAPALLGSPIGLRLQSDIVRALDRWIAEQPDPKPKRTEAIREILRMALGLLPEGHVTVGLEVVAPSVKAEANIVVEKSAFPQLGR